MAPPPHPPDGIYVRQSIKLEEKKEFLVLGFPVSILFFFSVKAQGKSGAINIETCVFGFLYIFL